MKNGAKSKPLIWNSLVHATPPISSSSKSVGVLWFSKQGIEIGIWWVELDHSNLNNSSDDNSDNT